MTDSSSFYLFFALYIGSFNLGKDNMSDSSRWKSTQLIVSQIDITAIN